MGLVIVMEITEKNGGNIDMRSDEGNWATNIDISVSAFM